MLVSLAFVALTASSIDRVAIARRNHEPYLRKRCAQIGVNYPPSRAYLVAYKAEKQLEVWISNATGPYRLYSRYPIAAASGDPGPKRMEGDGQVPEGVYRIIAFNPKSSYHLSMKLNYPNDSDRIRSNRLTPGNDIYIHGNQVSIGCMAMTDPKIEEIYLLCLGARKQTLPVYVFPCKMDGPTYQTLQAKHKQHRAFWKELEPIYTQLQSRHEPPLVRVGKEGAFLPTK